MNTRIIIACGWWIMMFAASAVTGCSQERASAQRPVASRASDNDVLHGGFRIRRDVVRDRIWLLGLDNVRVYDGQTRRLVRTIALPSWSVAGFACDPDLVLDRSGSAVVSSNAEARLWRIDGGTFEVSEHPITLKGRERWDVGFAALAVNGDGALLAMTSVSEAWWSIDLGNGSARMVGPAAPLNVCGLTMQSPGRAGARLNTFTHFVLAANSDDAEGSAVRGPNVALEGRLNP